MKTKKNWKIIKSKFLWNNHAAHGFLNGSKLFQVSAIQNYPTYIWVLRRLGEKGSWKKNPIFYILGRVYYFGSWYKKKIADLVTSLNFQYGPKIWKKKFFFEKIQNPSFKVWRCPIPRRVDIKSQYSYHKVYLSRSSL